MVARQAAAIPRFDETHYDGAQEVATFYENGEIVWRARAEPIGRYSGEFGLFRWWWHGQASHTRRARLDRARTEASRYDIQEFTVDHVYVSSDAEAMLVARVAAQLAQAHGVMEKTDEFGTSFVALFEPTGDTSLRAAAGTSETFPFVGDVTGPSAVQPPAFLYTAGIITEKNANLQPEYSSEYDLGADHRFKDSSVLSLDLQETTVHNVFQQLTTSVVTSVGGQPAILGIFKPINVARLQADLLTFKYVHAPLRGFGYNVALTADR